MQLLHTLCILRVIAHIVSPLGARFIDTAIVEYLHPSLENYSYHAVQALCLQLVGRFYFVELELNPASLMYVPHTYQDDYSTAHFPLGFSCQHSLHPSCPSCLGDLRRDATPYPPAQSAEPS
jgi:hypothetical protein